MKRTFALILLFFFNCGNLFAECLPDAATRLEKTAQEYREMRKISPPPSKVFTQRKAEVMDELRQCLEVGKADQKRIIQLMGSPDHLAKKGSDLYQLALHSLKFSETPRGLEKAKDALIYEWRGLHDFMFFITDGKQLIISGWWMAME
jgi:hypothetical protein